MEKEECIGCLSHRQREENVCTFRQLQREIIGIRRACTRHFSLVFNDDRTINRTAATEKATRERKTKEDRIQYND